MAAHWGLTYHAQVLGDAPHRHLRVWRHDTKPMRCGWDVLQRIKDDMLGPEAWAVEVFPETDALVDEANMRHLWECEACNKFERGAG